MWYNMHERLQRLRKDGVRILKIKPRLRAEAVGGTDLPLLRIGAEL